MLRHNYEETSLRRKHGRHMPAVDALRGLAASVVLFHHAFVFYSGSISESLRDTRF